MLGLLVKDLLVIKKELLKLILLIGIFAFIGQNFTMVSLLIALYVPMVAMAYDEKAKWNKLAGMLPYKQSEKTDVKYYLGFMSIVIVSTIILPTQYFLSLRSINIEFNFDLFILMISAVIIFQAINLPVLFKYGVEKGRFFFIVLFGAIGAFGGLLPDINIMEGIQNISPYIILLISLILTAISMFISNKIGVKER